MRDNVWRHVKSTLRSRRAQMMVVLADTTTLAVAVGVSAALFSLATRAAAPAMRLVRPPL